MRRYFKQATELLSKIYVDGMQLDDATGGAGLEDMCAKLCFGVLENDARLEYILSQLVRKRPHGKTFILLKVGVYALENLTDVPKFAIVSEAVEAAKAMGKSGVGGFVNAVLKRAADGEYALPKRGDKNYLSVLSGKPQWLLDELIARFGEEEAERIATEQAEQRVHIRPNGRLTDVDKVKAEIERADGIECEKTEVGGLLARLTPAVRKLFAQGKITIMSPSSMLAVEALDVDGSDCVLDMCSAPGGKAVYMSELTKFGSVTACDVSPKRLAQLRAYAERMGAKNVVARLQDGCVYNEEFEGRFDKVLVDAPCSCYGTFKKHPDLLVRPRADVEALVSTQKKLLSNAAKYVKKGGKIVYSTCTFTRREDEDIVGEALSACGLEFAGERAGAKRFALDGKQATVNCGEALVPPLGIYDGFYIAALRRKI